MNKPILETDIHLILFKFSLAVISLSACSFQHLTAWLLDYGLEGSVDKALKAVTHKESEAWQLVDVLNMYSETCLCDHLRNRDNMGIKDSYSSP